MHDTLLAALDAAAHGERGIHFIGGSSDEEFLSYALLREHALATLAGLQARGVRPGDELVLQFDSQRALVVTYWACLAGRIVPVPLELADQGAAADKVFAVWATLASPWLATDDARLPERLAGAAETVAGRAATWSAMQARWLQPLNAAGDPAAARVEAVTREDIAFVQYSSGSTGAPKGVVLTHGNLLTNIADMLGTLGHDENDRFLTWKPITHDFGMIAFHLAPLVAGSDQVRIATDAFIWNPSVWFALVHRFRATILGSPNFGYRHFLKLFARRRGPAPDWDLSCVKVILNGAEPISQDLCAEFARTLAPYGLPPHAMTPGYGLAEGSLIVSLSPRHETEVRSVSVDRRALGIGEQWRPLPPHDAHAVHFVDCGHPYPATEVRITDGKRRPLAPGHVGHIEIRGGAVTAGYYRNPEASARLIAGDGWLDTQDLGVLQDGRLFVVGRVKEMIVVGGVNYFPHDIEQAILRAQGDHQLNKYVVLGAPDADQGSEALLVFVYHKRSDGDFAPVAARVRAIVQDAFGLPVLHVLPAARIPKTTSGKVQRFKLLQDFQDGAYDEALAALGESRRVAAPEPVAADEADVLARVHAAAAAMLGRADFSDDASFFALGLGSLRLVQLRTALEDAFGVTLDSSSALDFPTVRRLAEHIAHSRDGGAASVPAAVATQEAIAIVATACRFPGDARTPAAFWELLANGVDPVREAPAQRWAHDPQAATTLTTRQGGFLDAIDQFDPLFFGIAPEEAVAMDPQQRLLLEVANEAIENAGWSPAALEGSRTGVFVGISGSEYAAVGRNLGHATGPYTFTGTMFNTAAGRIAYTFGLQGPCLAVDTACSSSLVAVHLGMRELRAGTCDQVLAGGVSLILRSDGHVSFSHLNALAASGRCRSFDDGADGYIRSEGCGLVLLKRLSDAERDGDPILAVLEGGAVNHNGRSGGLTVPSGPAQERLIRQALHDAGVNADAIDYVEAHGSGTRLGDPQELHALARVFGERRQPLRLGSVKSNIGHLESAAGVAGLIKVAHMLQRGQWVPNLHFRSGNKLVEWDQLPLSVVTEATAWDAPAGHVRRAGISSFGISGTNAHLVLREHRGAAEATPAAPRSHHVFALGARSAAGLRATAQAYAASAELAQADFGALCQDVARSRSTQPWRLALVAADFAGLRDQLLQLQDEELARPPRDAAARPVAFLFTGQGSVYPQVARGLYAGSAAFRTAFDHCATLFARHLPLRLQELLQEEKPGLAPASVSQPLIFAVEHALAAWWRAIGIRPAIVLGHSIGEYAAACEAGVLALEDAVSMVALRGQVMDEAAADGAMAGLLADEATVRQLLADFPDAHIAAINTDENFTVSASAATMAKLLQAARKARVFAEPLPMRHAFHSPLMAASAERLAAGLRGLHFGAPRLALVSGQTGAVVETAAAMSADYWSAHLCQPVRFREALRTVLGLGARSFIEIGGTATLSGLAAQVAGREDAPAFLPSLREGRADWEQLGLAVAALHRGGHAIDWDAFHDGARGMVAGLPNTGYERTAYWFEPMVRSEAAHPTGPLPGEGGGGGAPAADIETQVATEIRATISRVTGIPADRIEPDAQIFELGIDSLMLMQIDRRLTQRYGVEIPVKQFFAELDTPKRIAAFISANLAPAARAALQPAPAPVPATQDQDPVRRLIATQLEVMQQQLRLLGEPAAAARPVAAVRRLQAPSGRNVLRNMVLAEEDIDDRQRAFVRDLVARVAGRTPRSKAHAQRYRRPLADWIASLNFSLTLKEMAYPVVAERSRGSRFQDIDGNEYIDTAAGYGATFFGHNPDFITDAIRAQLDRGIELGPQSAIAGEVAERIARMTGAERVAFCNSGTEAVMVAVRLARAATGRTKVVRFTNAYHGSFDGVLAEAGEDGTQPVAAGIVDSMVQDTIVVPYNTPDSLAAIRAVGSELAAVLVEPVQSRAPTNHSRDYLQALRELTNELGAALIFDEMITGFRVHPGGVQALFGIRADLATYGKVVGGGMPIGVVAGTARFMDAIDGGAWDFGDDSGPGHETTFFAGTFCKHPLAMAAALAVLKKLEAEGPALVAQVDALTRSFCERANAFFAAEQVAIEAQCFGSLYRFETKASQDPARSALEMNLLFRLMQLEGVFVWERRTSFFSTAHTDEDAQKILEAVKSAVHALRAGGFGLRAIAGVASRAQPTAGSMDLDAAMLSSEERRMYVLSLMKGGEWAYHVTGALHLPHCDPARVEAALTQLAARHPMLRASYRVRDGQPIRDIAPHVTLPLRHLAQGGQPLDALLQDCIQPFALSQSPLWRAVLVSCGSAPGGHVLLLDLHHLVADGISMSILIEELALLLRGEPLPAPTGGYAGFVRWERDFLASPAHARQREHWLQVLNPQPAPLALPADHPRPAQFDFAGASERFVLGADLHAAVRRVARAERCTPFMVLLAAYCAWLRKATGQSDVCVGTPFDRRGHGDFERTLGMFAQTLTLRSTVHEQASFSALLAQVRATCMEAYAYPDCSLDTLVQALGLPRDASRSPLFDTMFIYENGDRRVSGDITTLPLAVKGSAFDLTLEVTDQQGELHGHFIYARSLFEPGTVRRWAREFQHLLAQLLAAPTALLADAALLDEAARTQLTVDFNRTALAHDRSATVSALFGQAADAAPAQLALVAGSTRLSYAELQARVQALAQRLQAAGVRRGDRVGILLPRTAAMVEAMLAVLAAGAAYIPLDPEYPAARIRFMLERSGAAVLLATDALAAGLDFSGRVIDPAHEEPVSGAALEPATAKDLAYVIFTSGSTGQPKCVMIEHAAVVNFLHGMREVLALPPRPVVLGLTTISFDIFVLEVFLTLTSGGTLVLADEAAQRDPARLARLLREEAVTVLQATPSRVQALLAGRPPQDVFGGLGHLLVGGEAFPGALLAPLQGLPRLRLFNMFGPTETTVWSTVKELTAARTITLGRPIANTRCYVLDADLQPRPIGGEGELWIAGEGLARGYLDDAEKTAAAFVADPFVPGERMYRTGDRAAWTAEGELLYRGRGDHQLKLRGYRIEVQEIEAVLQQLEEVDLAAVAVREPVAGQPVLVAYCTSRSALADADFAELVRSHATKLLPGYMVPALVQRLDALPMTPNGKIDRKQLPEVVAERGARAAETPLDALEAEIVGVWQQVLGERAIGLHDSFFDVGGNSFSLVAVHAALAARYPNRLEVADLFANPTVAALKAKLAATPGEELPQGLPLPPALLNKGAIPLAAQPMAVALDPEPASRLAALAQQLGAEPYEAAVAMFALYLHKLSGRASFEIAVGFRPAPEYVLVELDFGAVRDLRSLVGLVREQQRSGAWVTRRLLESAAGAAAAPSDRVRVLLLPSGSDDGRSRYGFDLVLRLQAGPGALVVHADYDGRRLLPTAMGAFVANFLKLVRVLAGAGAPELSLE